MADLISVIIPNWNGAAFLGECLRSLFAQQRSSFDLETIVIDNGSVDGSWELLQHDYPQVIVIANAQNVGFTQAVNQGVERAAGAWILLLNNDTIMMPGSLSALYEFLVSAPAAVAGVQPLLLRASDPRLIDSAGIAIAPHFRARDNLHGAPASLAPQTHSEIWGVCAACALIRKAAVLAAGGFDPDYFADWDDVDFCLRARWLGYRFVLIPEVQVLHHRSPSQKREPAAKIARHRRNQLYTFLKTLPDGLRWKFIGYRFARDCGMILHYLKYGELRLVAGVWTDLWKMRRTLRQRRRNLIAHAQLTAPQMRQQLCEFMKIGQIR
jgi:GT2 family glycosyltransferase